MTALPAQASVHPDTLQRAPQLSARAAYNQRRGMGPARNAHPSLSAWSAKPHPDAWQTALELAGGDVRRCRVQPDGSVLVLNHGKGGGGRRQTSPG